MTISVTRGKVKQMLRVVGLTLDIVKNNYGTDLDVSTGKK